MKIYFTLFFSVLFQILWSQSKFGLKVTAYPNISDVWYIEDEDFIDPMFPVSVVKEREIGSLSFSGGIGIQLKLGDRIKISTGANYVRTGYETKKAELRFPQPDPALPDAAKFRYRQHHIEVPVHMAFTVKNKEKWSLYFLTGPSLWLNLKNTTTQITYDGGKKERDTNEDDSVRYHSSNMVLTGGVGVSKEWGERKEFFVQPTVQVALFGMADNVLFNRRVHNFGLQFGVVFY